MYSLSQLLTIMKTVPILTRLELSQQRVLASKFQSEFAEPNKTIIKEGDLGRRLYIIVSGTVIVSKARKQRADQILGELGKGDFFGEIALLKNVPRTATIVSKTRCEFLALDASDFLHCYEHFPPMVRNDIQTIIAKRLQEQHLQPR